jgi:hypothetical protein
MGSATAARREDSKAPAVRSAAEFRTVLERALEEVEADERSGALLRAAALRVRFSFPDLRMVLNVAAGDDAEHPVHWSFEDGPEWSPRLELEMDAEVANAYLQGRESLAIAMARRRIRCRGEARVALLYVPAIRLLCEPYRRVVKAEYPHLAVA